MELKTKKASSNNPRIMFRGVCFLRKKLSSSIPAMVAKVPKNILNGTPLKVKRKTVAMIKRLNVTPRRTLKFFVIIALFFVIIALF